MEDASILIVEDERKIADTLQFGLREKGYLVQVAYDGAGGLQLFRSNKYDLVLLDINLPGMNGFDLCRLMRASDTRVAMIMVTSLLAMNDKKKGYDSGADDYLVKPFEFQELLLKIRAVLRRTASQPPDATNVLRVNDLEMNLDNREVKRADKRISLTAKEFELLEYLLRNKNKVVTRSDIAFHVWDIDFDTNTNVIDVYINYLRNKVDKPFDHKLIQTQVGMGYILKET